MLLNKIKNLCALSIFFAVANQAHGAPVDAVAVTQSTVSYFAGSDRPFSENLGSPTSQNMLDTSEYLVESRADLTTGEVRAGASIFGGPTNLASGGSGRAAIYEFLSFDQNAQVSFSLAYDGFLEGFGANDRAEFTTLAVLRDVTNVTQAFSTQFGFTDYSDDVYANAPVVGSVSTNIVYRGSNVNLGYQPDIEQVFDIGGMPLFIDDTLTGQVNVLANHTYALFISSSTVVSSANGQPVNSDFLSTSTFSFDDLGGAKFTSSSGEFLSNQTAVPIPAAAWLFGSAIAVLIGFRAKRA